ncbi:MAG TPA: DUF3352 domain-containing protein, partial [Pyrinomonadaceae bacterium]|nr:DUF3352 domain-containing protein [Pyrinomonadaceae bacterium]
QTTTTPAAGAGAQTQATNGAAAVGQQRAAPDRSIQELLSSDGFGVYVEVRRVGALARTEELKTAVGALEIFGAEMEPATDLFTFVSDNAEKLSEARAVMTFMPTREGLPQAFIALEFPSAEEAAAFEPKFRTFVGDKVEPLADELTGARAAQKSSAQRQQPGAGGQGVNAASKSQNGPRGNAQVSGQSGEQPSGAAGFAFRRVGRLLLTANEPFTLKKLRGEGGTNSLAENVRFQSARTRLSSDSLFVYVDTSLAQQGYEFEQQKAREQREALAAASAGDGNRAAIVVESTEAKPSPSPAPAIRATQTTPTATSTPTTPQTSVAVVASTQTTPEPSPTGTPQTQVSVAVQTSPTPDASASPETIPEDVSVVTVPSDAGGGRADAATATKPSEEQVTVWRMGGLLNNIVRGAPRIPGAVALGLRLEAGALVVRVAVENTPDGVVSVIPFLPNVVAGPPVTAAAAEVAPDDTDIFITTSLDWRRIYTSTLGTASLDPSLTHSWLGDGGGEDMDVNLSGITASRQKQPTPEETVAAVEKLFGFKIKEDLLPALGNEVAVSVPFNYLSGPRVFGPARKKDETDSEPGLVFIVALNDPDKVQEILPRALAAFQFVSLATPFAAPEKREGFEIHTAGEFAYVVINNFLVAGEDVKAIRHVIDSYAARHTLASTSAYRDSVSWQAQQKVVEVFVSDALMRSLIEDTKKKSGGSIDPVVQTLLAQLDMTPESSSYEATNEGDALVHELRVPTSLLKAYAASMLIATKDMAVISAESEAAYILRRVHFSEYQFKEGRKKERYATLEELFDEKLLEKDYVARLGYRVEINAVGDKFTATATPKTYGKTGRRSFFIDETGEVRGADHKGQPATADDPPID